LWALDKAWVCWPEQINVYPWLLIAQHLQVLSDKLLCGARTILEQVLCSCARSCVHPEVPVVELDICEVRPFC
jgi:hypothetical protein